MSLTPSLEARAPAMLSIQPASKYAAASMESEANDEDLMLSYRDGEPTAFEILYRRHRAPLFRYFLRQCGDNACAEELFQDTWIKLINARDRYVVTARFKTYLYHLAHNRLIDYYRSARRSLPVSYGDDPPALEELPGDSHDQPEHRLDLELAHEQLLGLIASLPEAQREAFLLREHAGLSLEEIARVTGVSPETAKSRLRYAVARLRAGMGMET